MKTSTASAWGGKGPYTVSGADVSLMGNGGNDFIGYGAGIMSGDDAVLTVEDSALLPRAQPAVPCLQAATSKSMSRTARFPQRTACCPTTMRTM